jgi:hypothetical protein
MAKDNLRVEDQFVIEGKKCTIQWGACAGDENLLVIVENLLVINPRL